MGTPPASRECHTAMAKILSGLKEDILIHGVGNKHNANLQASLERLYESGFCLDHIYSKQGMSPDPSKVEHIKA